MVGVDESLHTQGKDFPTMDHLIVYNDKVIRLIIIYDMHSTKVDKGESQNLLTGANLTSFIKRSVDLVS